MSDTPVNSVCACEGCKCQVEPGKAVISAGKAYCCQACAEHHPHYRPCNDQHCHCGDTAGAAH